MTVPSSQRHSLVSRGPSDGISFFMVYSINNSNDKDDPVVPADVDLTGTWSPSTIPWTPAPFNDDDDDDEYQWWNPQVPLPFM